MRACFAAVALDVQTSQSNCSAPPSGVIGAEIHDGDGLQSVEFRATLAINLNESISKFCAEQLPTISPATCQSTLRQRTLLALAQDVWQRIESCPQGSFVLPDTGDLRDFMCEQCYYAASRAHQAMHSLQSVVQLYREVLITMPTFAEVQFNLGAALQVLGDYEGGNRWPYSCASVLFAHIFVCIFVCIALEAYSTVLQRNPNYVEVSRVEQTMWR
jgi:hypothetical protein